MMLNTVKFGLIRIVPKSVIREPYDELICGDDYDRPCSAYEWWFYRLAANYGEVVAVAADPDS